MFLKRWFYRFTGAFGVHWRLNKRLFLWLGLFVLVGIVIGMLTVFNPKITAQNISTRLIDTNLFRVIRPTTGLGTLILGRTFFFALFFSLIFAVCLSRWTVWIAFLLAGYRGFTLVVNLYWVFAKFGIFTGMALFLIYIVLLLILLLIELCMIAFCLRVCEPVRKGGWRGGIKWSEFFRVVGIFLTIIIAFSLIEWFLYWLILSKIVFVV